MMIPTADYDAIVRAIRQWPVEKRFTLVQEVLQTLAPPSLPQPHKRTLQQALGIAASDQLAPTDADVKQWLEEHRGEKYAS